MTDPERFWHPNGRTRDEDLQILADSGQTGWWHDTGNRYRHPSTLARRIPQPQNRMDHRKPQQSQQKPARQRPRKPTILAAMLTRPETQLNWPENQRSNGRKPLDKTQLWVCCRDYWSAEGSRTGMDGERSCLPDSRWRPRAICSWPAGPRCWV